MSLFRRVLEGGVDLVEPSPYTLERHGVKHFDVPAEAPHNQSDLLMVSDGSHMRDARPDSGELFHCVIVVLIELIDDDIVMELSWLVLSVGL